MAEETTKPAMPDIRIDNVAPLLCEKLGVPGVIVITSHEDGMLMMFAHGVNHHRANECLSRCIQLNLNQHDEHVRHGVAGALAQAKQAMLDGAVAGGVQ